MLSGPTLELITAVTEGLSLLLNAEVDSRSAGVIAHLLLIGP